MDPLYERATAPGSGVAQDAPVGIDQELSAMVHASNRTGQPHNAFQDFTLETIATILELSHRVFFLPNFGGPRPRHSAVDRQPVTALEQLGDQRLRLVRRDAELAEGERALAVVELGFLVFERGQVGAAPE